MAAFWRTLTRNPSLPGVLLALAVLVIEVLVTDE
jgi:hypothetical protein